MMTKRFLVRLPLLALSGVLALPWCLAQSPTSPDSRGQPAAGETAEKPVTIRHLVPGPVDGRIAFVTARMLEVSHYLKQPFDASVSSKFLDRYLETLDPQHLHFTQQDLADFEPFRTNLDHLTLTRQQVADTEPACAIFNRFLERLQQRVAYADELLKHEKFEFNTDERVVLNRHELPYPQDLNEAKILWRQRLQLEYLQEKLGKVGATLPGESPAEPGAPPAGTTGDPRLQPAAAGAGPAGQPKAKSEAEQIVETLLHRYHRTLRTFAEWDSDDVLQVYLTALAHVYDPHSDYMGHATLDSFAISMNLSLFGIGAELVSEDGYCTIRRLLPGGPAIKSGTIKEKDRIIAVAQSNQPPVDVVEMSLNKIVQLIRGPKGTEVRLTVQPAAGRARPMVVTLIRDKIPLEDQAAKGKIIEFPGLQGEGLRVGVIDLPSFYTPFDLGDPKRSMELASADGRVVAKSTSADVALLLNKFKEENVRGVVLDLRRNGGGSLEEAIKVTGLFIKQGPVVQVRSADGNVQEDDDTDPSVAYDGPLVVLTSRFSASASEIVAGALQDYGRALIVGDCSTHGKGTVQSVNQLRPYLRLPDAVLTNDPGALKLTIRKFYRASGASTQKKGVIPDIVLPSVLNESKEIGEAALDNPLAWDTIPSAKFDRLNLVTPYLADVRKKSDERIASEKDWAYVREDIELMRKAQADKSLSLNEKQRLQEKEEADARQKARDKERLARKDPPEKVYELTLKQAEMPGLPPPVTKTNTVSSKLEDKTGSGLPGTITNAAVAKAPAKEGSPSDAAESEKPPAVDAPLVEAEHILVDYIGDLSKGSPLTAGEENRPPGS